VTSAELVILAGANGVGKTTYARSNLSSFIDQQAFLNADDIARAANPSDVEAVAIGAGRTMLRRRRKLIEEQLPFCMETTLATRTLLRSIEEARVVGYRVKLIFLFTPFANINELRVKQRVMAGGHNIDTDTIRRRHARGLTLATKASSSTREPICRWRSSERIRVACRWLIERVGRCSWSVFGLWEEHPSRPTERVLLIVEQQIGDAW
jgi:predicted ABC-type ATPase